MLFLFFCVHFPLGLRIRYSINGRGLNEANIKYDSCECDMQFLFLRASADGGIGAELYFGRSIDGARIV